MIRFLKRLLGVVIALVGVLVCLFGLVGYFSDTQSSSQIIAYAVGGVGACVTASGIVVARAAKNPSRQRPASVSPRTVTAAQLPRFEDFAWGRPQPGRNQFAYAALLGVAMRDGMTRNSLSQAMDEAKERLQSEDPASEEQLKTISEFHGVLRRQLTAAEADRVIEFLEQHSLPCPYCRSEVFAMDDSCCECGNSLQAMRIPVKI